MKVKLKNLNTGEETELDAIEEIDGALSDDAQYGSFELVDSFEFEVKIDDDFKDLILDEEMEVPKCLH